jgi:hypothetical protein
MGGTEVRLITSRMASPTLKLMLNSRGISEQFIDGNAWDE